MTPPSEEQLNAALDALLPPDQREGDPVDVLCAAAREALRRRTETVKYGGAVIAALRTLGLSWREIENRTGIPQATARRWFPSDQET